MRHLKASQVERDGQQRQAARVKQVLGEAGLPVLLTPTHIVPVMVRDAETCKAASDRLLERHDIYIQPINYPTVPRGTERLRITPTPLHGEAHIGHLRDALLETWGGARPAAARGARRRRVRRAAARNGRIPRAEHFLHRNRPAALATPRAIRYPPAASETQRAPAPFAAVAQW